MDEAAGHAQHHLAATLAPLQSANGQGAAGAGDAHVHQPALFFQPLLRHLRRHVFVARAKRQHAFVDAGQHHVLPLQAFGRVQGRQRHHVLLVTALGQADDDADALRHLEHALGIALLTGVVIAAHTSTALGDPVDKVQHVGPACGGDLGAVFTVMQVLLVGDVFQPTQQQHTRVVTARGVARAAFEIVHGAAEFMQRVDRLALQRGGQAG